MTFMTLMTLMIYTTAQHIQTSLSDVVGLKVLSIFTQSTIVPLGSCMELLLVFGSKMD